MLWVKSSQRRNSPRINRFQQGSGGRERRGLAAEECGLERSLTMSVCIPLSGSASLLLPSLLFLSHHTHASFLCVHLPLLQALNYDCMQCASFSGIVRDMYVILRNYRAWPQLSVTWTSRTQHSAVPFHPFPNDIQDGCSVQGTVLWGTYLCWKHSFIQFQ